MLGIYLSLFAILAVAALSGQALFVLCGRREWSWLAPAVGLGLVCALAWATVRLPGEGSTALIALGVLSMVGAAIVGPDWREYLRQIAPGIPTLVGALVLVSLPFVAEGHAGILGTSLNPDMSQHLFAADRLSSGGVERLISQGYPLGPHSVVVALSATSITLVQGFGGLTLAISVVACLASLELLRDLSAVRRSLGALLIGLAYMAASYLIQGAFKETMEATLLLAFAIALNELGAGRLGGAAPAPRWRRTGALPLTALAIGAAYSYSFPGLLWMFGALGVWVVIELVLGRRSPRNRLARLMIGPRNLRRRVLAAIGPPTAIGLGALLVAIAPELGRMSKFAGFQTFDPKGAGLGNLFNPISPLEALGIWPSGDFRLDAGAGFAPAIAFWAGAALAALVLAYGLLRCWRAGERALPSALAAALALYLYALVSGTPYQEAKAIVVGAPLAAMISVRAILQALPATIEVRWLRVPRNLLLGGTGAVFLAAATGCTLLALANGPVGPSQWSPALTEFRTSGQIDGGVVVQAPRSYLARHGGDLIEWELRNNRLCIGSDGATAGYDARVLVALPGSDPPARDGSPVDEIDGTRLYRIAQPLSTLGKLKQCPLFGVDRAGPGS